MGLSIVIVVDITFIKSSLLLYISRHRHLLSYHNHHPSFIIFSCHRHLLSYRNLCSSFFSCHRHIFSYRNHHQSVLCSAFLLVIITYYHIVITISRSSFSLFAGFASWSLFYLFSDCPRESDQRSWRGSPRTMIPYRKGLVAPQNTFLETIIRSSTNQR